MNNTYNEIINRMKKPENNELYNNFWKTASKEYNLINFHLERIKKYNEGISNNLEKADFNVSVREIYNFMEREGWK